MLFRKHIEPMCSYCKYSQKLGERELSCKHRGITQPSSSCRHFQYDPLKRVPPKPAKLNLKGLSDEDFRID